VVPLCLVSTAAIAYGLPQDPQRLERFRSFNWVGLLTGFPAISMLVIGLYQGDRLDWLNSPLICVMLGGGGLLFCLFLLNEWSHPLPFFKLRMLAQRNFTHSLITLAGVLVVLLGVAVIPSDYLIEVRGYRPLQIAPLALVVALPQLIALPVTAAILNIERVDCRWVLGLGLTLVAASCALGSFMTSDWVRENFYLLQALLTIGEPMAVIPLLMEVTTGLTPTEGPFASAMFNMVKGFAAAAGIYALVHLPLDAIPDLSDTQVIVYTEDPGQAPQVVEDQVTYPLTTAMLTVPKSKAVRGFSFQRETLALTPRMCSCRLARR